MNKFDLLKSHIDAFTRKDGSVVAAHDDKRTKAFEKKVFKAGDNASDSGGVRMLGRQKTDMHRDAMDHLGEQQNYLMANGFRAKSRTGGKDGSTEKRSSFGPIHDGDTHHEADFEHSDGRKTSLSWKADANKHVVTLSHDPDAPAKK